tara:strand:- start:3421 stop:4074 length:654 start_codon:yes stop_codon:yes gene_type:complete
VSINVGSQLLSNTFTDNDSFELFVEDGRFSSNYQGQRDVSFDVGAGIPVWRNLSVGSALTYINHNSPATISAELPHPFFFDRHRNIEGTAEALGRREIAVHIQALWTIPFSQNIFLAVFAGPTFFNLKQELVNTVEFTEGYPFDTADFSGVSTVHASDSTIGFHAGVDLAAYFTEHLGLGGVIRFSKGAANLARTTEHVISSPVGGMHATGGLRIRF